MKTDSFEKSYEGRQVLVCPDLDLRPGVVTALIGANGSGKSTLAKVLVGLEQPDDRNWRRPEGRIGYLPQKSFAFRLTTEGNVLLGGSDRNRARELMAALGLEELRSHRAKRLSGGETAKMALARVLMGSYDLVILDEPTAAMDMESTLAAEELMVDYAQKRQAAVLLITHNLQQARRVAEEAIFLSRGSLVEQGPAATVLEHPTQEETRRFLEFYG